MRLEAISALILIAPLCSCTQPHNADLVSDIASGTPEVFDPWAEVNIFSFDIVQRTCALEVVMRPVALQVPDVFDRTAAPWDMDAHVTKLACT